MMLACCKTERYVTVGPNSWLLGHARKTSLLFSSLVVNTLNAVGGYSKRDEAKLQTHRNKMLKRSGDLLKQRCPNIGAPVSVASFTDSVYADV